jgi:hypothetical protein
MNCPEYNSISKRQKEPAEPVLRNDRQCGREKDVPERDSEVIIQIDKPKKPAAQLYIGYILQLLIANIYITGTADKSESFLQIRMNIN